MMKWREVLDTVLAQPVHHVQIVVASAARKQYTMAAVGLPRSMTDAMLEALLALHDLPNLYLDEMTIFLQGNFNEPVSKATISCHSAPAKSSKKVACRITKEQRADLRDMHLHGLSSFE